MIDKSLIGRSKELEVAGVLIRNGIYVFWPLLDKGADLLATNHDASICIPVQVKYETVRVGLHLHRKYLKLFKTPNTVLAFLAGGNQPRSWYLPFKEWASKMVDNHRGDDKLFVPIRENEEWLRKFQGDEGVKACFGKLLRK